MRRYIPSSEVPLLVSLFIILLCTIRYPFVQSQDSFVGFTSIQVLINSTKMNMSLMDLEPISPVQILTMNGTWEHATIKNCGIYHWLAKIWLRTSDENFYYYYVVPTHMWWLSNYTSTTNIQESDQVLTLDKTMAEVTVIGRDSAPGDYVYCVYENVTKSFVLSSNIVTGTSDLLKIDTRQNHW